MFTTTRKIITTFLSLIIVASAVIAPVQAINADSRAVIVEPGIDPQWQNTISTAVVLSFSGSTIVISADACGYMGTTFSDGSVILTKLTGSNTGVVKKWTNLSSSMPVFTFHDESLTTIGSGIYRLNFSITATRNGVSEVITGYDDAIY